MACCVLHMMSRCNSVRGKKEEMEGGREGDNIQPCSYDCLINRILDRNINLTFTLNS